MARAHGVPASHVATDWRDFLSGPRIADAVIIATPDGEHAEAAVAFADRGYHILLEKPMALDPPGCRRIVQAVEKNDILAAVCHVLRYMPSTQRVREMVDRGLIGEVVNVQRLEPVGYWHQAHAYVRGSWRRQHGGASMLLAKCCHDLDWLRLIIGERCTAVHSFGSLKHFRAENRPPGAADRCVACAEEPSCPYSAVRIYLRRVERGETGWPVDVLVPEVTRDDVVDALRSGPYGRCVYGCDNDGVDNQVVNLSFAGGQTASLTMMGFSAMAFRQTRVFGTRGELIDEGHTIRHFDFLTERWRETRLDLEPALPGGHGDGDRALMEAFVGAVRAGDPTRILSSPAESLESHLMAFAAERARLEHRVVRMEELDPA
jgi:predicted dehydrogenase